MPRKLKGFIQNYLSYTDKQESPEMFHLWSCISILSAALGRKCYVNRGYFVCYPNQYIIIVSESARCRKTTATDIAIKLYRDSAINSVLMEKITSASLSRYLHEQCQTTGESSCFIYSPELGTFLGSDSYATGLMLLITTLYGCPGDWESRTKTQGIDILKDVFINIIGCTVPQWLSKMPADMVEGGFSSRTIFVVHNIPRPPQPRPKITKQMLALYNDLINDLREIFKLSGEFTCTEEAEICFDSWYNQEYQRIDDQDPRLKAYFARKGEHVMKLAMVLSASATDNKIIESHDIQNSLTFLKQVENNMATAFRGVSFSESTKHIDRITSMIEQNGGKMDHATLARKNRFYMDKDELRKVIEGLIDMNIIRMEVKGVRKVYIVI